MTDLMIPQTKVTKHQAIAQAANRAAARHTFSDYRERKSKETLRRHSGDLAAFAKFLGSVGIPTGDLDTDPEAWEGIEWGLVKAFLKAQQVEGYAMGTVNLRLSTIKTYAKLAWQAGALAETVYLLIASVRGYSHKEGKRIDEAREAEGIPTRVGDKKAEAVSITHKQATTLKGLFSGGGQGRRDALLMALLIDHGLRVGEVAALTVANFDLKTGTMTFFRPKVDKVQTHELTDDALLSAKAYLTQDALAVGPLLRSSRKGGRLHGAGMTVRAICKRVKTLGKYVGVDGLSPHDLRHYCATKLARTKSIKELMDIFGWSSPAMAVRYIESARVVQVK